MPIERREGYRLWVGGPVPKGSSGITLGSLIIVRAGAEQSDYLIRHERVHVAQFARLGAARFVVRYVAGYLAGRLRHYGHRSAYLRIPLEIDADWTARRQLAEVARGHGSESAHSR